MNDERKQTTNSFERQLPFVSFVILTYNHAEFINDALDGAFSQEYSNMEIIVSDDASPDKTFEVIQQYLRDHPTNKKICINRNRNNLGLVPHINYLMNNLVHGDIVVFAGGDNVSFPNRVTDSVAIFEENSSTVAVTGQAVIIDGQGNITGDFNCVGEGIYSLNDEYIRKTSFMCGGVGPAYRKKEVWEQFGALHPSCPTEDSTLRLRALLCGQMVVSDKLFSKYRIHGNNMSIGPNVYKLKSRKIASQYLRDLKVAQELSLQPRAIIKRLYRKAWLYYIDRQFSYAMSKTKYKYLKYSIKKLQKAIRKIVKLL